MIHRPPKRIQTTAKTPPARSRPEELSDHPITIDKNEAIPEISKERLTAISA
jgi:hypothetical protein